MQQHRAFVPAPPRGSDAEILAGTFAAIGWDKPAAQFELYLDEQEEGRRWVCVAEWGQVVAGYITVLWESDDPRFRGSGIPEVVDLNVLPEYRRRGIGLALLSQAEAEVSARADVIGIRVGLHSGYGSAQRLYVSNGYVPDERESLRRGSDRRGRDGSPG